MEAITSRRRPSQGFPIVPLPEAVRILRHAGKFGTEHQRNAFAQYMGHRTTNSGAFKARLAAFRDWGLVTTGDDMITMTPLGKRIALPPDPALEIEDLQTAFRMCTSFARIFDSCAKGQPLDTSTIANNAVHAAGISASSKDRFATSFVKSVIGAGLGREAGAGRVVLGDAGTTTGTHDDDVAGSLAAGLSLDEPAKVKRRRSDETIGADVSLPWSLPNGRVLFEIRLAGPLPATAFAKLAHATEAIEELVSLLRDAQSPAALEPPTPIASDATHSQTATDRDDQLEGSVPN